MFPKAKNETNTNIALINNGESQLQDIIIENETKDEENAIYEEEKNVHRSYKQTISKAIFYAIVIPIIYVFVITESYLTTSNAYHAFSWLATLFSVSYILCIIHTLCFSKQLCYHTIDYQIMNGITLNYIPSKLNIHHDKPWNSISKMAHIRGSSIYKWHTALMNYGSFSVISGAIIKLFDIQNNTAQEIVGVYLLLCGGIGGLIIANFEVYTSPSFSKKYNLCCDVIHTFGALNYAITGNLSYAMYNNFNISGCCLFTLTICVLIFYRVNRIYQYKRNFTNIDKVDKVAYGKWVHNMSVVNIGLEIGAIIPSAIAMCGLIYQFGSE
eukprot:430068_1